MQVAFRARAITHSDTCLHPKMGAYNEAQLIGRSIPQIDVRLAHTAPRLTGLFRLSPVGSSGHVQPLRRAAGIRQLVIDVEVGPAIAYAVPVRRHAIRSWLAIATQLSIKAMLGNRSPTVGNRSTSEL